jgi:amidase
VREILFEPAVDAAELVRSKQVSSRELTEAALARIDAVNPSLIALVELRAEAALEEAAEADAALSGGAQGPLLGLPITIKEAFNVAGLHTTWGNPAFEDYIADSDATVVTRLKESGAIVVGKSNVAAMLADFAQTSNELYGTTNNPWDLTRTPGGSSGGAAAAVASGISFLDYGSDLVGSIRIPASFCGVYGLKPSVGIVPQTGFQPPGRTAPPSEMTYMSALGPFARSARDLRLALELTAGPEAPTARAYSWRLAPPRHARIADFRVGAVFDDEHATVSSEITSRLSEVIDALARAGASVSEGWPSNVDPGSVAECFNFHVGLFFAVQQPDEGFEAMPSFLEQENRRMSARAAWSRYFEEIDVFLCPTNFTPAFPHDERPFDERTVVTPEGEQPYTNQPFWITHASVPGLPAVAAPIGRARSGLPVGVQIIAPLYEDDTALTFAELLADLIGGYESPPERGTR